MTDQHTVLGRETSAAAWTVQFLEAPCQHVVEELTNWRQSQGHNTSTTNVASLSDGFRQLDPLEAPWTKELIMNCGAWTAYMNNGLHGGDATASASVVADRLHCTMVSAQHTPLYDDNASTHFWLSGPTGVPPLMYIRTLQVARESGHWTWTGDNETPLSFENLERYRSPRIADRLDRKLLITYLEHFGIFPDRENFWSDGYVVRQHVDWPTRKVSFSEALSEITTLRP